MLTLILRALTTWRPTLGHGLIPAIVRDRQQGCSQLESDTVSLLRHHLGNQSILSTSHVDACGLIAFINLDIPNPPFSSSPTLLPVEMANSTAAMTPAALRTLLEGPAMSPPAGITPNFQKPSDFAAFATLTLVLGFTFGTLAVLLRMYTKVYILRSLAWEDCRVPSLSSCMIVAVKLLTLFRRHCPGMGEVGSIHGRCFH